ncbi:CopG family transcriptional regulator [Desulfonatronovibrio magnus]|uniref:CopG family transcriptional regulator n=1 Tax=Desulfonatronovibrio magnus TaxID=698827 RepID=UPI0005EB04C2|nr:CopG family transcriptional regulator [Desulfonatronovibrio magnus]RQD65365.1 MAG: CopG family transcriptional regulator [Desulfonatronovibrio sp. MSAO_Bac4]
MKSVKTAISIEKPLFEQINSLADEMNMSRSRIFSLAAKEFIQRHKNKDLLDAINSAYDDVTDEKEASLKTAMRSRHSNMVQDQW